MTHLFEFEKKIFKSNFSLYRPIVEIKIFGSDSLEIRKIVFTCLSFYNI